MKNPFYPLLVVVGVVFAVTACAYGVMALVALDDAATAASESPRHPLLAWLEAHGARSMLVQLGVLAVLTCAAIGTDSFWDRRTNAAQRRESAQS